MMKTYHPNCERLGICQDLTADLCPDCDQNLRPDTNFARPWAGPAGAPLRSAANLDSDPNFCPPRFECAQPTYPFAPGVIDGPYDRAHVGRTLKELAAVALLVLLASALGGLLAVLITGWAA